MKLPGETQKDGVTTYGAGSLNFLNLGDTTNTGAALFQAIPGNISAWLNSTAEKLIKEEKWEEPPF
jgi:hypothetical protein